MDARLEQFLSNFRENHDAIEARTQKSIEENRKSDMTLSFTNKDGNPLKNVQVSIKQKTHDFRFGCNLFMLDELETEEKNEIYGEASDSELEKLMKDSISATGMSISNFKRTKTKNDYSDIIKLTYTLSASGVSMKQTQMIATVGDRTYVVTVTETTADQTLVDNVFNTFVVLK